ncbi:MAG: Eco57I restriction-modification methylase domain-containing protein [Niastella sp.]|nr:Eco57I restriction-modification methylase domain-containing protein [Niastella sp.]
MTKEELHEKLREKYTRDNWKQIVNAIFPNREFFATEESVEMTKQSQRDLTQNMIRFGNIKLDDGNSLALYEVELKPNASNVTRNRVGLRNLITSEVIPGIVDGALIVYHQAGHDDWRFSFYSKSKYWDDEGSEIKKETHPKRYTYVLGKGETCVTPRERFWHLVEKRTRTIKDVLEAFSVEKVSKEFFVKYKKHYQAFVDSLTSSHFKANVFNGDDKTIRDFVKKMLGRLVFLQFLQKKGWLDVAIDKHYGQGNKNFVAEFFANNNNDAFYSTCLVPLFFETLNNPKNEIFKVTKTKFPYLNGGLFERDEIEKKAKADFIVFNKDLFENLFGFLGEYNFTIDESTPDDLDIGIDPEMLGHIFENLLEDNREKGAFYTPKLIVQYMCQEVLIQYLELHLGRDAAIEKFIRYKDRGDENDKHNFIRKQASKISELLDAVKICDPAIGSGAFPMGLLQEIFHAKLALDWTLLDKKGDVKRAIIQNSIYGVDKDKGAVDIARLRFWLSLIVDEDVEEGEKPQPLPNFDYKIMQGDSLLESFKGYSLKYHDIQEELPQTDLFNTQTQINIFKKTHTDLAALEKDFFDPKNNHRKEEIRNEIDALVAHSIEQSFKESIAEKKKLSQSITRNIAPKGSKERSKQEKNIAILETDVEQMQQALKDIKPLLKKDEKPWFLWHLFFKDVFDKGGFDIVVGNPPYIRQESITDIKPYLEKIDGKPNYEVYNSTSDIYTYFFELGHKILKADKGVFSYICSKRYAKANYGKNLRAYLYKNTTLTNYVDFIDFKVFDAGVDTSIIFLSNIKSTSKYTFRYCSVKNDLTRNSQLFEYTLKNESILSSETISGDMWNFSSLGETTLMQAIEKCGIKLENCKVEFNRGITTGFNKAFYLTTEEKERLIEKEPIAKNVIKPILRGKDISKYKNEFKDIWLLYIPWHFPLNDSKISGASKEAEKALKNEYPEIYKHLNSFKEELSDRNKEETGIRYEWYALQRYANTFIKNFKEPKLIWAELSTIPSFSIENEGFLTNDTVFILIGENLKYLAGVLNSALSKWYFTRINPNIGGSNRWKKTFIGKFPIPEISKTEMQPFEILVDYVTFIKKHEERISPYTPNDHMAANFEEIIDACVYELYFKEHMKEKEIAVIAEVTELLKPIDNLDEKTQAKKIISIINKVYDEYKSTDNIIRRRILDFPVKSADIINVIQNG